ncbi:MAG: FecR family protein, partial [Pirellulales bacterium]|nr:FecR family protein [Pirellulales bacterium]
VEAEEIATLTNWHRPEWVKEHAISPRNHRIEAGQKIAFTSGGIELTYDAGAKVVIEGPAELVVGGKQKAEGGRKQGTAAERARKKAGRGSGSRSEDEDTEVHPSSFRLHPLGNSGFLRRGKLVARVEGEKAQGFTIDTPSARFEDLGTEFGVEVDSVGTAELHVIEGEVNLRPRGDDAKMRSFVVSANEAIVVRALDGEPSVLRAQYAASKFRWANSFTERRGDTPLYLVNFQDPASAKDDATHWDNISHKIPNARAKIRDQHSEGRITLDLGAAGHGYPTRVMQHPKLRRTLGLVYRGVVAWGPGDGPITFKELPALGDGGTWELTIYCDLNDSQKADEQKRTADYNVTDDTISRSARIQME